VLYGKAVEVKDPTLRLYAVGGVPRDSGGGMSRNTAALQERNMASYITVRDLFLYLLWEDYKDKERRIKRGDTGAGGRWAGAP
jgi:hypothetical protein